MQMRRSAMIYDLNTNSNSDWNTSDSSLDNVDDPDEILDKEKELGNTRKSSRYGPKLAKKSTCL